MYKTILQEATASDATLVAVSKRKPNEAIMELYEQGHRDFGENYVQELVDKYEALPKDINWHFIGTLQRNKVKYITPFVHLIHGVDSLKLMTEINKRGQQNGRIIDVLLQVDVTSEETKHGFTPTELVETMESNDIHRLAWARPSGIMGMASNTSDKVQLGDEFKQLKELFDTVRVKYYDRRPDWNHLSMGMSGDYQLALKQGSSMLRVGSLIFGARD
ncbi:MAG: YggS family pyridoxal phosphate-dependent enzyme [Saprospiraceae bacterium]